jgi:NADPH-dependent glutamate synthase beta subunit-like oxidoreductase
VIIVASIYDILTCMVMGKLGMMIIGFVREGLTGLEVTMQKVPSENLEIDRKVRVYMPYHDVPLRSARERVGDGEDVVIPFDADRARVEASRCIHCPDPAPCMLACPCHNDIPSCMWLIEQGLFVEASLLYRETSSLPEMCSRVCPHEQLCQGSCVLNKTHEPVLCGPLEAFTTSYERNVQTVTIPVGAPTGKKVAIVGAGPAGLACSESLLQQGHAVTLFEKEDKLGGQLVIASLPTHKQELNLTREYLIRQVEKSGAKVRLGREATAMIIEEEKPDAVIVATGILPLIPKIRGIDRSNVISAEDVLWDKREVGEKVVVIGGVMVGCETAEFLAEHGKKVTIVEVKSTKGAVVIKPKKLVDPEDTLTPEEEKIVERGFKQLKRGESVTWEHLKRELGM